MREVGGEWEAPIKIDTQFPQFRDGGQKKIFVRAPLARMPQTPPPTTPDPLHTL